MIRVLFVIRSLEVGGAERQLIEVAGGLDKSRFDVIVASFYDGGALQKELETRPGVRVLCLGKAGRWDTVPFLFRFWRTACALRPDIIQSYMPVTNELSLLVGGLVGAPVVWGIRHSRLDFSRYNWAERASFRFAAPLSRQVRAIIFNSAAGRDYYVGHGYRKDRTVVIPNGIDIERFRPNRSAGRASRREWGVADEHQLIGIVGRIDPMKDHPMFLRAAAGLAGRRDDVSFVCVGDGPSAYRDELRSMAQRLGLDGRLVWAGARTDMPEIYNALDILTSASSFGEGFSNVVGEAMACGVPCVVTDVGDSARIVGRNDCVVRAGDDAELTSVWERLLNLPSEERDVLGQTARERIVTEFSVRQLAERTAECLDRVIEGARPVTAAHAGEAAP